MEGIEVQGMVQRRSEGTREGGRETSKEVP